MKIFHFLLKFAYSPSRIYDLNILTLPLFLLSEFLFQDFWTSFSFEICFLNRLNFGLMFEFTFSAFCEYKKSSKKNSNCWVLNPWWENIFIDGMRLFFPLPLWTYWEYWDWFSAVKVQVVCCKISLLCKKGRVCKYKCDFIFLFQSAEQVIVSLIYLRPTGSTEPVAISLSLNLNVTL